MSTTPYRPPFLPSHFIKNSLLISLSLGCLPLSSMLVFLSVSFRLLHCLFSSRTGQTVANGPRKTILITGVSMAKGLALARILHEHAHHRIVGADDEPVLCALSPGRFSHAISKFYRLDSPTLDSGDSRERDTTPYITSLLRVIEIENVDLWISCSSVASSVEDGKVAEIVERKTRGKCRVVQFGVQMTERLHEKDRFTTYMKELGERVPATWICERKESMEMILSGREDAAKSRSGKETSMQFITKSVGLSDSTRADMTLLPLPTLSATRAYISQLPMSMKNPWLLQEFIAGPEFCTHALVVRGRVRAFVACPSSELLMNYKALPPESELSRAMLQFTKRVAKSGGTGFTGHLSFDFLLRMKDSRVGDTLNETQEPELYPIECNPRAHTAVVLFRGMKELGERYLEILEVDGMDKGFRGVSKTHHIAMPNNPPKYYWVGHDLVTLLILPVLRLLSGWGSLREAQKDASNFITHLLFWKDGTFEIWDPLPFWWLYHVYWPMQFLNCIVTGRKWSRINVSTTKMFEC